jgi:8-oxo-dGTP pyrophosphatase MutT (NUDIX family)
MVEVCIFRFQNHGPEYLLLQRAHNEELYPNSWQIVSGGSEAGETAIATALRELHEETQLAPERMWTVPHLNVFYDPRNDVIQHSPVFAVEVAPNAEPVLSHEHQAFEWCQLVRAKKLLVWPGQVGALEITHDYIVGGRPAAALTEIRLDKSRAENKP